MAFRMIEYTVNLIRAHLKKYKTQKIPLVVPLVIYHGKRCHFETNIEALVDAPKELSERYFLKTFQLMNN